MTLSAKKAAAYIQKKHPAIQQASASFDSLKSRLRMAHELKLISHQKYAHIITKNEEIGNMLAGWSAWAKNKNTPFNL